MATDDPRADAAIRDISDTAIWAATYRARESERRDAVFRDPFALRLAGERGARIAASMPSQTRHAWAWVTRTFLFDSFIREQVGRGADMVVNLAAGLDARPYRMPLPRNLRWVEVDLPGLIAYKEEVLHDERPACALERIPLDLSDAAARRALFDRLGREAGKALIVTEGFLVYLTVDEVATLARDLAAPRGFKRWILDLASPGLVRMIQKEVGAHLTQAGSPLKFGPEEGPEFFVPCGWRPADVSSTLRAAARIRRSPLLLRLLALLPESNGRQGSRPWSATCLLAKGQAD
jgi:methyltransferase (TIGR00027 family)